MRYIFFILILLGSLLKAQTDDLPVRDSVVVDNGQKDSIQIFRPTIDDYQFFTQFSQRKAFDTVFTIGKSYQFTQYNNRDNFGKIQFANIGEGFQNLVYKTDAEQDLALLPTRKSFFILGIKDIKYYDVKSPTTAFYYHNGMSSGGTLQTTYTQNIGKRFNFAIEYMGLRSEGLYQREIASSNNTIFSAHYLSKNSKYEAFAHFIHQNISNEENGGIANLENFTSGDSRFNSRKNLTVNLHNTYTRMAARRFYFSHYFAPFDVEKFPFKLSHTIFYQTNKYFYTQDDTENYYSSSLITGYTTNNKRKSTKFSNTVSLLFDNEAFRAEAGVRYQNISYRSFYPLIISGVQEDSKFKENRLGLVGNLKIKLWDKINLNSDLEISNGKAFGNYLNSENYLTFEPIKGYSISGHVKFKSAAPSFNYLMNTSFYQDYNFKYSDFKNQNVLEIGVDLNLKWFDTKLFANYFRIGQLAYFDSSAMPQQSTSPVNISQVGGEATFSYRKFNFNAKVLVQNVLNNKDVLPLPEFIGRANVYYQSKIFKKAAEIQTGIKAYYFSKFASQQYFPILNEFILPSSDSHSIGGRPLVDVYFNMKVKRMMIYAEAQHLNTTFMKNQSYAAPFYPVADFRLNLGLVWYLFH